MTWADNNKSKTPPFRSSCGARVRLWRSNLNWQKSQSFDPCLLINIMTSNGKYLNAISEAGTMKNLYLSWYKVSIVTGLHSVTGLITFINLALFSNILFFQSRTDSHELATRGAETAGTAQPTEAAAQGAVAIKATNQETGTAGTAQLTAQAANERAGMTAMVQATTQGDGTTGVVLPTATTTQAINVDGQASENVNKIKNLEERNRTLTKKNEEFQKVILEKTERLKVYLP